MLQSPQHPHLRKTFRSGKRSVITTASKKAEKNCCWSISCTCTVSAEQHLLGTWSGPQLFFLSESICLADEYRKREGRRACQAWFSVNEFGLYSNQAFSVSTRKYLLHQGSYFSQAAPDLPQTGTGYSQLSPRSGCKADHPAGTVGWLQPPVPSLLEARPQRRGVSSDSSQHRAPCRQRCCLSRETSSHSLLYPQHSTPTCIQASSYSPPSPHVFPPALELRQGRPSPSFLAARLRHAAARLLQAIGPGPAWPPRSGTSRRSRCFLPFSGILQVFSSPGGNQKQHLTPAFLLDTCAKRPAPARRCDGRDADSSSRAQGRDARLVLTKPEPACDSSLRLSTASLWLGTSLTSTAPRTARETAGAGGGGTREEEERWVCEVWSTLTTAQGRAGSVSSINKLRRRSQTSG